MLIYKITNIKNSKIYIGKTTKSLEHRFKIHKSYAIKGKGGCPALQNAMIKYGIDNFTIEQIETATTEHELNDKEKYWIAYYNSTDRTIGYNLTDGGEDTNTYKYKSDEELNLIKDKIRKTKYGKSNPMSLAVKAKNILTNEEYHFDSISECASFLKRDGYREFIIKRCNGSIKCLYNNEWNFAYEGDAYNNLTKTKIYARSKQLEVYNTIDNTTKQYASIKQFSKEYNLNYKTFLRKLNIANSNNILLEFNNYKIKLLS